MGHPVMIGISMIRFSFLHVALGLILIPLAAAGQQIAEPGAPQQSKEADTFFIVNEYRFEATENGSDPDIGQFLCGKRCNAISSDYLNYKKPEWRILRTANNKEMRVDLKNPFMKGQCVCVGDEYKVIVHELYMSKEDSMFYRRKQTDK